MRKENLKLGIHGPQFEIELRVRELTLCKPNEGKNSVSLKDLLEKLKRKVRRQITIKKKRGVGFEDLMVEAGPQPHRQQ